MTSENAQYQEQTLPSATITSIGKNDTDKARDFKDRAAESLRGLCVIMDEAMRDGLLIRWSAIQPNAFGKNEVIDLHVVKRF